MVYGAMPDVLRRRFDFPWSNRDRVGFAAICTALRCAGPAVTRGALAEAWPEGTPHLDITDRNGTSVVVAPANPRQRTRPGEPATAA